ncbi:MAG: coenzyme F420-0:L-glutamate ligase [Acidiferrobacteraceae bacterium]|nr:coenzyme F420-0:L-glutamate ligase [Acidiferrobacteraceae bacterium]
MLEEQLGLTLTITVIDRFPLVEVGDDIVEMTVSCLSRQGIDIQSGDVIAFAQKIVSKAEDRAVYLHDIDPGPKAIDLGHQTGKDPRLVELILSESEDIIRHIPDLIISAHRLGIVLANAGIDHSNVGPSDHGDQVLLLPRDPDSTSEKYRQQFFDRTGKEVGILITDSAGRAWRNGTIGVAIGLAGFSAIKDHRGKPDLFGTLLTSSEEAIADELACAANLMQGQASEGRPVVLIRGAPVERATSSAQELVRRKEFDLFR